MMIGLTVVRKSFTTKGRSQLEGYEKGCWHGGYYRYLLCLCDREVEKRTQRQNILAVVIM